VFTQSSQAKGSQPNDAIKFDYFNDIWGGLDVLYGKLGRSRVKQAYGNFKGKIVNTHSMAEAIKKGIKIGQQEAAKWKAYMHEKIKKAMDAFKININGGGSGGINISTGGSGGFKINTGGSGGIHINAGGMKINGSSIHAMTNNIHKAIAGAHANAGAIGKSLRDSANAHASAIGKAISGAHAKISASGTRGGALHFSGGAGAKNGFSTGGHFSFKVHRRSLALKRRLQSSTANGADSIKVSKQNGLDLKKTYDSTGMGKVDDDDLEGSDDQVKMTDGNSSANLLRVALSVMLALMFVILH